MGIFRNIVVKTAVKKALLDVTNEIEEINGPSGIAVGKKPIHNAAGTALSMNRRSYILKLTTGTATRETKRAGLLLAF